MSFLYKKKLLSTGAERAAALWLSDSSRAADGRMVGKKRAVKKGKRTPIGERVQFLTMMHPDVIADIKQVAIDEHRAAWDVMEQAAREFIKRREKKKER